jgi:GPH family glycoside/pentoside/hexuronide:cation symporter
MKKTLGLDKDGIQLTMGEREKWGFATGIAGYLAISIITGSLSYFYTDKVGVTAGLAGTALLASRIADAFTDLVMGHIVDRTRSKWGKARPWLLWMIIPLILAVILLLLVPKGLSETGKFIYMVITNVFATAIVLTAIQIPYNCLFFYRTRSQIERTGMNIRRVIFSFVIALPLGVGFIPLTNKLGGDQAAWIKAGIIVVSVAALCLFICFKSTKELYSDTGEESENEVPFLIGIRTIFKNKYWVIMALAQLFLELGNAVSSASTVYYARWVFGDENLVATLSMLAMMPTVLGFFIVSPLVKRFGPFNVARSFMPLAIIAAVGLSVFPRNFAAVCVFKGLFLLGTMPYSMVDNVLINNVADFEEWRSGKKIVGLINSAISFGKKTGIGLGAGIVGWVLALGGYESAAIAQSESAMVSIFAVGNWIPGILVVVLFLLLNAYDLEKKYPNFRKELADRR